MLLYALFPYSWFSTIHTGIDGLMTPAIGPTAPWWWFGSRRTAPLAASLCASSGDDAHLEEDAPVTAPCIGPHISPHDMGGPHAAASSRPYPG